MAHQQGQFLQEFHPARFGLSLSLIDRNYDIDTLPIRKGYYIGDRFFVEKTFMESANCSLVGEAEINFTLAEI